MAKFYVGALDGLTITMSETENASYPMANLKTYDSDDLWKSSTADNNQTLNMDAGAALPMDFVIIEGHNFGSMNQVDLQVDAADNPAFTSPVTVKSWTAGSIPSPQLTTFASVTKRYRRLLFVDCNGATPQLGQIFINSAFDTVYSQIWPYEAKNEVFVTSSRRSLTGVMRTAQSYKGILTWKLQFERMPQAFQTAWIRFHQKVRGAACPFYFVDEASAMWYVLLGADDNPVETFRYQIYNSGDITLVSQKVHQNPLS